MFLFEKSKHAFNTSYTYASTYTMSGYRDKSLGAIKSEAKALYLAKFLWRGALCRSGKKEREKKKEEKERKKTRTRFTGRGSLESRVSRRPLSRPVVYQRCSLNSDRSLLSTRAGERIPRVESLERAARKMVVSQAKAPRVSVRCPLSDGHLVGRQYSARFASK